MDKDREKATAFYNKKEYKKALIFFDKAILKDANNADLFSERGVCQFHLQELDAAFADLSEALKLEPNNPYRYSSRAYIRDANGDVDGAIIDYQTATLLDPEDAISQNNLGLLLEKKGRLKKAKEHFKKADELLPKVPNTEAKPSQYPTENSPEEIQQPKTTMDVIKNVFLKKSTFKEFIQFITKGFKV